MDLHDLGAVDTAAAIRSGEVSAAEVTASALARIDRLSATVGAFVHVMSDAALVAARAADDALRRARSEGDLSALPPLLGVPVAVKDLSDVAGAPTGFGTRAIEPYVADTDDNVVALLRAASMTIVGKTATPEFGLAAYTDPDGYPVARTPWDLARSAGGSSGGSAAAVAARIVPVAHGSDGAGSVRTPASVCGLVGLKPSRGRVSLGPRGGDTAGLATHGILARSVVDAAAVLDAVARPMPGDTVWLPEPPEPFAVAAGRRPGRLRIGRHRVPLLADVDVHPDVLAAYDAATDALLALGHDVVDTDPPLPHECAADFETVWAVGAATIPLAPDAEGRLRPLTRWLRDRGRDIVGTEYAAALGRLALAARQALARTSEFDAVLVPTLASPPVAVDAMRDDADPPADFAAQERFNPFSAAYNLTGQPAVTVPVSWTADGLPIGVQLVGRPAGEAVVLALAAALEEVRPWSGRVPTLP